MTRKEAKEEYAENICEDCPWTNGDIPHLCDGICEGRYCDDALDNYCINNDIELEDE